MRPRKSMDRAAAEAIALQALAFLSEDESRLVRFLELSGLRPETLRTAAASPDFLAGVLDHVASDEVLILALAQSLRVKPEAIMEARHVLSPTFD